MKSSNTNINTKDLDNSKCNLKTYICLVKESNASENIINEFLANTPCIIKDIKFYNKRIFIIYDDKSTL